MVKKKAESSSIAAVKPVAIRKSRKSTTAITVPVIKASFVQDIEEPACVTGRAEVEVTVDFALLLTDLVKFIFGGKQ